jgi:hypothetical protein
MYSPVWKSFAPAKCKIFAWLALRYRLWTSDRRARFGLQENPDPCFTCLQEEDRVDHILIQCPYAGWTGLVGGATQCYSQHIGEGFGVELGKMVDGGEEKSDEAG